MDVSHFSSLILSASLLRSIDLDGHLVGSDDVAECRHCATCFRCMLTRGLRREKKKRIPMTLLMNRRPK